MKITPIRNHNYNNGFRTKYLKPASMSLDILSFTSYKECKDYSPVYVRKLEGLINDNEAFNEYLRTLDSQNMVSSLRILADRRYLPMLRMDEQNIDRFIGEAGSTALRYFSQQKDSNGGNLYQFASADLLKKFIYKLKPKTVAMGCFMQNITGSNAFHVSRNDIDKLALFCDVLEPHDIKLAATSENGYKETPFKLYEAAPLAILLEKLSSDDVMDLAKIRYEDETICLHNFDADKTEVVCNKLSKEQIKELCKTQEKWGRTPFHMASDGALKVLCNYLDEDDIREICEIENAYRVKPYQQRQIPKI